jgi:hypothetical protein
MRDIVTRRKYALDIPAVAWIMAFTMAFWVISPIGAQSSETDIIEHRAGGIDVAVRFDNLDRFRAGTATTLEFTISMDTHVVNLFQFDLTEVTEIRVNGREIDGTSFRWVGDSEDSHHRLGRLIVGAPAELKGTPITGDIELRMLGVGTAVRTFTWES